jgi:hypothetical protein
MATDGTIVGDEVSDRDKTSTPPSPFPGKCSRLRGLSSENSGNRTVVFGAGRTKMPMMMGLLGSHAPESARHILIRLGLAWQLSGSAHTGSVHVGISLLLGDIKMRQSKRSGKALISSILIGLISLMSFGCAPTYYKVTDTTTNREYYTQRVVRKASGSVEFVDAKTKAKVTLPSSEVRPISEVTYHEGMTGQ